MIKHDKIERKITGSIMAEIHGDLNELESPLFAINWFDTRIAIIYHIYNLLAAGRVFKIGGKALFKGKCQRTISGNADLARDYLLIVNYPSGYRFLELLSDKLFQLMSVLRIAAVNRFSFVLHQRQGEPQLLPDSKSVIDPNDHYAVLQMQLPTESKEDGKPFDFSALNKLAAQHDSQVFFAGRVAGRVVLNKAEQNEPEALVYLTDVTVLIKSSTANNVLACFASDQVESLLPNGADYFTAQVKRTM